MDNAIHLTILSHVFYGMSISKWHIFSLFFIFSPIVSAVKADNVSYFEFIH